MRSMRPKSPPDSAEKTSKRGFGGIALVISLYNAHVSLVELQHLKWSASTVRNQQQGFKEATYLLRAPLVDDACFVLRLMPVLPRQVNHQLVGLFILAGIELQNVLLP